jgi:hypothetical protein
LEEFPIEQGSGYRLHHNFLAYNKDMRLNPSLPLSDTFQARLAAQAILRNQFDMKKAVAELRPDIKQWRSFGQRLLAEPAVQHKLEIIMCRGDRNAQKFLKLMWDWLEAPPDAQDKSVTERRLSAARILAKGYIREKGPSETDYKPLVVDGMEEGLVNLVGAALAAKRKAN